MSLASFHEQYRYGKWFSANGLRIPIPNEVCLKIGAEKIITVLTAGFGAFYLPIFRLARNAESPLISAQTTLMSKL